MLICTPRSMYALVLSSFASCFPPFPPLPLQAVVLKDLTDGCYPPASAANKLATLKAKAIKSRIMAPFPLMDLVEFLPSWAEEVCHSPLRWRVVLPFAPALSGFCPERWRC